MSLNIQHCLATIRHALTGADISADLDAIAVINRAGEYLISMHDWSWLIRKATLSVTDGQDFVNLPTNLRMMMAIQSPLGVDGAGAGAGVQLATVQELVDRRNNNISSTPPASKYLGAVVGYTDDSSGGDGRVFFRLEIWPTPTVDSGGEDIDIFYRMGWKAVDNETETDLDMPTWVEEVYLQILRAFAKGIEAEEVVQLDARLEGIARGTLYRSAVMRDSVVQPHFGSIRNSAVDAARGIAELRSGSVLPPS